MEPRKTPLYNSIVAQKGRMVSFAGYLMPVQFSSIIEEHQAVRTTAGLFDVSHMTEFRVTGAGAKAAVNQMVTNDLDKLVPGQVQYNLMCTEDGGIVDDLLVYLYSDDNVLLVMNAACRERDLAHIKNTISPNVVFTDESDHTAQLALQGPNSPAIMKNLAGGVDFLDLDYMTFKEGPLLGQKMLVSRTGYTGEDGFEIYCTNQDAPRLFDALLTAGKPLGLLPVGLGARDTLRLEAKLPLYGNDLSLETSPIDARLKWAVGLKKNDFVGKKAIIQHLTATDRLRLVGFEMTDRAIGRHGYNVVSLEGDNRVIGQVTSGGPAPSLGKNIGLAYLPKTHTRVGTPIGIEIRGKIKHARIVKTPFYKRKIA